MSTPNETPLSPESRAALEAAMATLSRLAADMYRQLADQSTDLAAHLAREHQAGAAIVATVTVSPRPALELHMVPGDGAEAMTLGIVRFSEPVSLQ